MYQHHHRRQGKVSHDQVADGTSHEPWNKCHDDIAKDRKMPSQSFYLSTGRITRSEIARLCVGRCMAHISFVSSNRDSSEPLHSEIASVTWRRGRMENDKNRKDNRTKQSIICYPDEPRACKI